MRRHAGVLAVLLLVAPAVIAGVVLQPTLAPEWEVSTWLNDDGGSLRDHRGRVVLVAFFRVEPPAAAEFSAPLFRRWTALYRDRADVDVVILHSSREARGEPSQQQLRSFIRENELPFPVGLDAYVVSGIHASITAARYEVHDTPHLVIVDREGRLRFTHFGVFDPVPVEAFVERLLEESPGARWHSTPVRVSEDAEVGPAIDELHGAWSFRTDPATGICATWVSSGTARAELNVRRDAIDIEFHPPFLGLSALETTYDAATDRIAGEGIDGVFDREADPPELTFELTLLDGRCTVSGRALALRGGG